MSRLYYEPAFRAAPAPKALGEPVAAANKPGPAAEFLQKVSQLIPTEVLAVFLAGFGVAGTAAEPVRGYAMLSIFAACLIATPLYLFKASAGDPPQAPRLTHIALSTLAFVVWSYAIAGAPLFGTWYQPTFAALLPMIFMLFAGLVPLNK